MQIIRLSSFAFILMMFSTSSYAGDDLSVVSSIKPIHSLVAGVMKGVGEPKLIVKGAQTPHGYSLKPSQMRHLQQAKLIFWIGANLETFLTKPLENLKANAKIVTLSEAQNLTLLAFREEEEEEEEEDHKGEHKHEHHGLDMHLWLDPINAKILVHEIEQSLIQADPEHVDLYRANAQKMQSRLDSLNVEIEGLLKPVKDKPYFVFHDAYQYFEKRYSLSPAGFLTINPEISPGAKHLSQLKSQASKVEAGCIFSEPQFKTKALSKVISAGAFKTAVLDPTGALLNEGSELYFNLIKNMTQTIKDCLTP